MHRVVEHVDRHLDAELDLATLADVAHFSPFHFHRLFAAWMGETLGDYVRRRRLEVAATRLAAQPRVPVLQIALSTGFGSSEAFAEIAISQRLNAAKDFLDKYKNMPNVDMKLYDERMKDVTKAVKREEKARKKAAKGGGAGKGAP